MAEEEFADNEYVQEGWQPFWKNRPPADDDHEVSGRQTVSLCSETRLSTRYSKETA
jgi:hypothetical protein